MKNNKIFSLLLVISLILSMVVPFSTVLADNHLITLTILGTTDVHGNIYDWSYEDGEIDDDVGLAKIYSIVKEVREENPNTLLIDNGDTIQGTVLTDDLYNMNLENSNPIIDVMNYMEYDSMTLGNHEFNFGLELIDKIKKEANFPILSANIYNKEDESNFMDPYTIKELSGIKIGILGLTTPNIPKWDGPKVTDLEFKSMAKEAKKYADILKNEEKVDIIIATSHAGLDARHGNEGSSSKYILEEVPEIDALLVGHDHEEIAKKISGVPVGAADDKGNQVVRFDLTIENKNGTYDVIDSKVQLIETKNYQASKDIKEYAKEYHNKTLEFLKESIGTSTGDFHPKSKIKGIPEAQIRDTAVIDLINEVQLEYTGADISAAALFKQDSNIEKGEVSYSDIFDIYKYPNTLYAVEVTGEELKQYMEWSASYFNQYKEGDSTISFNPEIRGYNYDMFAGVDYKIDISKPAGQRIVDLTYEGVSIKDNDIFKLAINNYRYGGLKDMGIISNDEYFNSDPKSLRSYIADYIEKKGTISPKTDNNWEIIGYDFNHWAREEAISLINDGIFEIPSSKDGRTPNVKSINLENQITRGEYIKYLVRALDIPTYDVEKIKFTDVEEELVPYVDAALREGITEGENDTTFNPNRLVDREQAFTMLVRALELTKEYDLKALGNFKDKSLISNWADENISAAIELGIINGYPNNTIRPQKTITMGELASILYNYTERFHKFDILSTNDFHGKLEGGYEAGASKVAAFFNKYKESNPEGTVILDAGDAFQGTPMSNIFKGKPVVEYYNLVNYDVMTVGNHEFDWGIEEILKRLKDAKFELVVSNIYKDGKLADWAKPYTIIEKNDIDIGIIGFATPETAVTAHSDFVGEYTFEDPSKIAKQLIPEVKSKGADIVILLTHIPGNMDDNGKMSGELIDLAENVEADVIIGGHSHNTVTGTVNGNIVVEAYKHGRELGHVTLIYDTKNNVVIGKDVEVIPVRKSEYEISTVKEVQNIVDKYAEELEPIFGEVIGKVSKDVVTDYNNESAMGNWFTDVMKESSQSDIAFTNAGGIRTDIKAGDITVGDIYEVMPFDNKIVTGKMTGEQIKQIVEQGATLYKGMIQVSGLNIEYDATKEEGNRVTKITLSNGEKLDMDKTYVVATNDFLAGGQDGFVTFDEVEWSDPYEATLLRDALIKDIRENGTVDAEVEGRIIDISKDSALNVSGLNIAA